MSVPKVLVITPTTGAPELTDAVDSVLAQTFRGVEHLIVTDGSQFVSRTQSIIGIEHSSIYHVSLPFNTGSNGFYGHRIMAAFGHLVPHDYVLFLDQDNWINPDHVETLVNCCEHKKLDWAYSLREIYNKDKEYVCQDNCESLGKWEIATSPGNYLIDTSSYCFSNSFIRAVSHLWDYGWGADRRFYNIVKTLDQFKYDCSGHYSLAYRLGGNEGSVTKEFFLYGNQVNKDRYGSVFPWNDK